MEQTKEINFEVKYEVHMKDKVFPLTIKTSHDMKDGNIVLNINDIKEEIQETIFKMTEISVHIDDIIINEIIVF